MADDIDARIAALEQRIAELAAPEPGPLAAPMGWFQVAPGETILADHMNTAIRYAAVPFASAAARDAAWAGPHKGALCYLQDVARYEEYSGSGWEPHVAVRYGVVAGLNGSQAGTNNFDVTATLTVPAAPYARIALVGARGSFTVTGTGTPPRLRILRDATATTPDVPFAAASPTASITTVYGLDPGVAAAFKANVNVPSGITVTSYSYENQLWAVVLRAGSALAALEALPGPGPQDEGDA